MDDPTNVKETPSHKARPGNASAVTHGAYSYLKRGEAALDGSGRSLHAQIQESVQTREGVRELMMKHATDAVMVLALVRNRVVEEAQSGKPVEDIGALKMLGVFMNAAQRALRDLYSVLPDEQHTLDLDALINGEDEDEENHE